MTIIRLVLIASALASFAAGARAQGAPPQQSDQSGYQGCSSRNKPAATS